MSPRRIPNAAYMYKPKGRRDLTRARMRWEAEAGTGNTPKNRSTAAATTVINNSYNDISVRVILLI